MATLRTSNKHTEKQNSLFLMFFIAASSNGARIIPVGGCPVEASKPHDPLSAVRASSLDHSELHGFFLC